jgi:hypothetical protein
MWAYQDFQAAVLRDQERAMGLSELGAYSRSRAIRLQDDEIVISGVAFSKGKLGAGFRNRHFTQLLIPVFILFHLTLFFAAVFGVSLQK